jgi:uncharacterized membrane protein YqjE
VREAVRFLVLFGAIWCAVWAIFILVSSLVLIVTDPNTRLALMKAWGVASAVFAAIAAPLFYRSAPNDHH